MAKSEGEKEIERQAWWGQQDRLIDIVQREKALRDAFCATGLTRLKEGRHKDADGRFLGKASGDKRTGFHVSESPAE